MLIPALIRMAIFLAGAWVLKLTHKPLLCAGIVALANVVSSMAVIGSEGIPGQDLASSAGIYFVLALALFWILDRLGGSIFWWVFAALGMLLMGIL